MKYYEKARSWITLVKMISKNNKLTLLINSLKINKHRIFFFLDCIEIRYLDDQWTWDTSHGKHSNNTHTHRIHHTLLNEISLIISYSILD